jgi:hypothetical protein
MDFERDETLRDRAVRLFSTSHIKQGSEAEMRATAALLATVCAVPDFGKEVIRAAKGKSGGKITCFTEVEMAMEKEHDRPNFRVDGIIRTKYGKSEWKALLEVKTSTSKLEQEQIDNYYWLTRQEAFDIIVTISNESARADGSPPLKMGNARRKKTVHLTWERLLTTAMKLRNSEAVIDKEQSWILDEWIRYVEDDNSKILQKPSLGINWNKVTKNAKARVLASDVTSLNDVVEHWIGFERTMAGRLEAILDKVKVKPRWAQKEKKNPSLFVKRIREEALRESTLSSTLKIEKTVGDVTIVLDLLTKSVRYKVEFDAPMKDKKTRQKTNINWLLTQLRKGDEVPSGLIIDIEWDARPRVIWRNTLETLKVAVKNPFRDKEKSVIDKKVMPRKFILEWAVEWGKVKKSEQILDFVYNHLVQFYRRVIEEIVPYQEKPSLMPAEETKDLESMTSRVAKEVVEKSTNLS